MSDKDFTFGANSYSTGEVQYIIALLSAMKNINQIQAMFAKFTGSDKSLPGQVIQQIQLKFADKISKQKETYLNNIDGNPLAHPRIRLDLYLNIYETCLIEKAVRVVKRNDDENIVVYEPMDVTSALNALKAARDDINMQEKLKLEKGVEDPEKKPNTSWELKDGLG